MNIYLKMLAVALTPFLLAGPVLAEDDGEYSGDPYVFISGGAGLALHACASQNNPSGNTCHSNYPVFRAGFGYQYTPTWALEASYGQFGYAWSTGYSTAFPNPPGPGYYAWEMKVTGLAVHLVGTFHLSDDLSIIGKVGLARLEFDESLKLYSPTTGYWYYAVPYNEKRNALAIGFGARYRVTPHATISALVESYGSHNIYNLGLSYQVHLTVLPVIALQYNY